VEQAYKAIATTTGASAGHLTASAVTGFGTTYIPTSTGSGPAMVTTNAASRVAGSVAGLFAGAVVAAMAL